MRRGLAAAAFHLLVGAKETLKSAQNTRQTKGHTECARSDARSVRIRTAADHIRNGCVIPAEVSSPVPFKSSGAAAVGRASCDRETAR
ncbi:hypothetical protein SKAU_G00148480 [Synaphobranchus kaupii]|uniref:Uncharacterized protein n=1 Tax=Synaphobranchus kaupii TaxID=118154 RepID=A0A9Q1J2T1_SYNKA|nr:hypothetical protein SKAU_G00148480 [Synaphobranchus kaupii]